MVVGGADFAGFAILHTRKSPSNVCVASMSDFCLAEEACHARLTIGEGALAVVNVCKMVKAGCNDTIRIDPFEYLIHISISSILQNCICVPDRICLAV